MVLGRDRERATLQRLLDEAGRGRSAVLVVHGEPGIGKTALIDDFAAGATGFRVLRATGVEAELDLPYAALHQLCAGLPDDRLPDPQRDALHIAFGTREGQPDPFLLGLATLTLISEAAAARPVLCVVDDAQWVDRASLQTFAFVARRLATESTLMIFTVRDDVPVLRGLPDLHLRGLADTDARALLASVVRWPLDESVRTAILAEARGNPLALLEFPRDPALLAGGFGLPEAAGDRLEHSFRRRLDDLSPEARRMLLLAAAHPAGDSTVFWRAARALNLDEVPDLLTVGVRVAFRHPLVRSAVYGSAEPNERRLVHAALAEAAIDPDRRAWHRAQAAEGPDESVAAELVASAGRARARGGMAASAAFLDRAASLTADPGLRADRELAAARATYQAGAPEAAVRLLAGAEAGPPDELRDARITLLRGQMAFSMPGGDAPTLLLDAARRLEKLDVRLARETYLDAFAAAILAGRFGGDALADIARAAKDAPPAESSGPDQLLDGLAVLFTEGFATGTPLVREALAAIQRDELRLDEAMHWLYLIGHLSYTTWDDTVWHALISRYLDLVREAGALARLPYLASHRMGLHLHRGELDLAGALVEELEAVDAATGTGRPAYAALAVAAWKGETTKALRLIETLTPEVIARREGAVLTMVEYCSALLHNSLGDYATAHAAASRATEHALETGFVNNALAELVEAASRLGDFPAAQRALERLAERTTPSGTSWALGVEARSRALVTGDERLYRSAIDHLTGSPGAFSLARAHLVYGEWLSDQRRRDDSRTQLRQAHDQFVSFGAEAFADRTRRALATVGDTPKPGRATDTNGLTEQERQIARRAADGLSNAQIGAELFLSPRTVEWHLRKVFTKLGITNRRGLRRPA
ncbi:ATP-binding protein [Actinoplanes solisilvae]|uniref:ATP-binding protein n=1 Tax=Actinoplanes solisilvae TaxID=2486853 RepID=UPI000FD99199|nr:LuxR family transcriptional regulator [Actinoplanes solisilvae]